MKTKPEAASKEASRERHLWDLSFVTVKKPRGSGLHYWSVEPTGDNIEDQKRGREMALEALEFMAWEWDTSGGLLLNSFVRDMGEQGLLEYGFLGCIGHFATRCRREHGDAFYRDYMQREEEALEEYGKMEARERSERARKAAQARWKGHKKKR